MEAIFGLVGVVVGSGLVLLYNLYRDRREREEKYRVMTYEKRLEVYQKAYYCVEQLLDEFGLWLGGYGYPTDERLTVTYRDAKSFYDSNCLYLDERSRSEIDRGLIATRIYLEEPDEDQIKVAFNQLLKAQKAIEAGIGMKHIEEPKEEQTEDKS